LAVVGLVGSIDNDMWGTDMTIGADSALHRISSAVDAISSTAASHHRIFVVEVMGRRCGYLALMGALITGADWVVIPEHLPGGKNWKQTMIDELKGGMKGKRSVIVILAEGVTDDQGHEISSDEVAKALQEGLRREDESKAEVRVTILGHVQRGGSPSAYDRILSTSMGYAAVKIIMHEDTFDNPCIIGIKGNKIECLALNETVNTTQQVSREIERGKLSEVMALRGDFFIKSHKIALCLMKPISRVPLLDKNSPRFAVLHTGSPAPGMNAAVRAAVRLAMDRGCEIWGVKRGFEGLIKGNLKKLEWTEVNGWASSGGAELGTGREIPSGQDFLHINNSMKSFNIRGLLIVGGWCGYECAYELLNKRDLFPDFNIPIVCIPASIGNNLPGTEVSIGSDTALNNIVEIVDKIKQSAVAIHRCFVVEVRGRYCGYLALMSGLASGAERVYLHEEGITLEDLRQDLQRLTREFGEKERRVALMIRNEMANSSYNPTFMTSLFNEESRGYFDARQAVLGHLQQGGNPSPQDRILAAHLADKAVQFLVREVKNPSPKCAFIGMKDGEVISTDLGLFNQMVEGTYQRTINPWWMKMRDIADILAQEPQ
jgi:6-phosphofructokinase 1